MTDNSSFSDIKKIFRENHIEQKEDDNEELEVNEVIRRWSQKDNGYG